MTDQIDEHKFFVGFDVSKETINFALIDAQGCVFHEGIWPNQAIEINQGLKAIQQSFGLPELSVFEPTGNYEVQLADSLIKAKFLSHKANTTRLSAFAKSQSNIKTDRTDARFIGEYARQNVGRLRIFTHKNKVLEQIRKLAERRFDLIEMRKAEKQRLKAPAVERFIKSNIEQHLAYLNKQLLKIEQRIHDLIAKDQTVHKVHTFLLDQDGIGKATALNILAHFPEIGQLKGKQAVAMAGLAPIARDSGKKFGYRRTGYGRMPLRNALFMATLVATRKGSKFHDYYIRKTQNSGSKMKALIATAAKILNVLNAKVRDFALEQNLELSR